VRPYETGVVWAKVTLEQDRLHHTLTDTAAAAATGAATAATW